MHPGQTPETRGAAPGQASDAELIGRLRAGDPEASAALYGRHHAAALAVARRRALDDSDAEDLVAGGFARVDAAIRSGGGPDTFFRASLCTAVSRLAFARSGQAARQQTTDGIGPFERGDEHADPVMRRYEAGVVAGAYTGLPERWQAVLWHTEVEGLEPARIAPLLGLGPDAVPALAVRAREGLRQACLQQHAGAVDQRRCSETAALLGAYARNGLRRRQGAAVENHLDGCARCTAVLAQVDDVGASLRAIVVPLVLGAGAGAWLAPGLPAAGAATAPRPASGGRVHGAAGRLVLRGGPVAAAAAAALAVALAGAAGWAAWSGRIADASLDRPARPTAGGQAPAPGPGAGPRAGGAAPTAEPPAPVASLVPAPPSTERPEATISAMPTPGAGPGAGPGATAPPETSAPGTAPSTSSGRGEAGTPSSTRPPATADAARTDPGPSRSGTPTPEPEPTPPAATAASPSPSTSASPAPPTEGAPSTPPSSGPAPDGGPTGSGSASGAPGGAGQEPAGTLVIGTPDAGGSGERTFSVDLLLDGAWEAARTNLSVDVVDAAGAPVAVDVDAEAPGCDGGGGSWSCGDTRAVTLEVGPLTDSDPEAELLVTATSESADCLEGSVPLRPRELGTLAGCAG